MENFNRYYGIRSVTFNVTNACNLRCDYCFEKDKNPCSMTVESALKMAEEIDRNFTEVTLKRQPNTTLHIFFFGGEPMLRMDVVKAVTDYFNSKPYFVEFGITTNLTLLKDEYIGFFRDNDFGILVSLDGTKENHDKHRSGSYDTVVANLKKLIDAGLVCNTEVRLTLPPDAVGTMAQGVREVFDMGVNNIAPMIVYDQPWKDEDWRTFEREIRKVFDFAMDVYNDTSNKRNLAIKAFDEYIEDCLIKTNRNEVPCGMGNEVFISLAPNGDVSPCHQVPTNKRNSDLVMGNILTDEFNGERILEVRRQREFSNRCQACGHRSICSGGCPIENYRATGEFTKAADTWCRYIEIMARVIADYQERIFRTKNLRNRKLTIIQENLKLQDLLLKIRNSDFNDPMLMIYIAEVQKFIFNNERILMPAFREMAEYVMADFARRVGEEITSIEEEAA